MSKTIDEIKNIEKEKLKISKQKQKERDKKIKQRAKEQLKKAKQKEKEFKAKQINKLGSLIFEKISKEAQEYVLSADTEKLKKWTDVFVSKAQK